MDTISQFGLIFLLLAISINCLLGFIVWRSNSKSATNITFGLLCIVTSMWLIAVSVSQNPDFISTRLFWIRSTLFFAVPQSLLFFILAYIIPQETTSIPKKWLYFIIFSAGLIMLLTISPYTFTKLELANGVPSPVPGPGLIAFVTLAVFSSAAAVFVLIKKYSYAIGDLKDQLRLVAYGILIMLGLIILTILFPVILFQNSFFVPFSPIYVLAFLAPTAYAIVKHHLFNLKVIATEAFTTLLLIILFSKIITSETVNEATLDFFIFITAAILGALLIRSVGNEVHQREQLEILTKQLENANEQLQALDKARSEFITIASHQLRTPPATIKWYLSSILAGDFGKVAKPQKEIVEKTNRTNNSLISLIDDMLNVSRIERGKMEFLFEKANLLDLAKITFEQLEPIAKEKHLEITFKAPKHIPEIMADKEKIRQVMNNMIDNAIKYTKTGSVNAELAANEDEIRFSVKDSGKGMSNEEKQEIFEKFKRGKESAKQSAGLGLGLYVAKVIIEQHKGKIWAESEGEGKGSAFIFTVPINNGLQQTSVVDLTKNQV